MAEYQNLQATINAVIKANGVQAITGPVLNAVLNSMVTVLGDGYRFGGVAAPADNPGSPDNRVAYLASQDGTYTNFGGLTLSGEVALLCWDSAWTKETLFSIDAAPTPGSDNLISSGAVDTALTNLANTIAAAYMQLVPSAVEDNLASYDNAGQVKDSGIAAGDVVLKGGAYLGLFAGYAANLVDTRSAGTPQGPYAFRQSGGDGVDYMVRIKGRTEAFNQLVQNGNFTDTSNWGDMNSPVWSVSGGVATLTRAAQSGTSINTAIKTAITFVNGHTYAVFANIKSNNAATEVRISVTGGVSVVVEDYTLYSAWGRAAAVFTCTDSSNNELRLYGRNNLDNTQDINFSLSEIVLVDLTLEGLGLTTAAAFQALHPLPYYDYNAGELKNNAATGIKTRGFNQWDGLLEAGYYDSTTGGKMSSSSYNRCVNPIPVVGGQTYYLRIDNQTLIHWFAYDANMNLLNGGAERNWNTAAEITMPNNARYITIYSQYNNRIQPENKLCINLSDASRNGIYEPYWERTVALGLDSLACHDENNNAVTLNGLDGVGSAYDEAVVENGMVTKIIKRFEEVDLGDLTYSNIQDSTSIFRASVADYKPSANINSVNAKYQTTADNVNFYSTAADIAALPDKSSIKYYVSGVPSNQICFKDTAYSDAATFKTAMSGVKLRYELATPKVLTVDNPFPAFVEVDNLGTEKRLPEDTAADPQGPFESDSNYSVSTAKLVRALGL